MRQREKRPRPPLRTLGDEGDVEGLRKQNRGDPSIFLTPLSLSGPGRSPGHFVFAAPLSKSLSGGVPVALPRCRTARTVGIANLLAGVVLAKRPGPLRSSTSRRFRHSDWQGSEGRCLSTQ